MQVDSPMGDKVWLFDKSTFMATSMRRGMLKSWEMIAQRRPYIPFVSLAKIPLRSVLRLWFITIVCSTVTSLAAHWMNPTRCARSASRPWRAVLALKAPTLTMRSNVCLQMTAPATTKARLFSLATPSKRINSCGELLWWCKGCSLPGDIRAHGGSLCSNPWMASFYC